MPFDVQPAADAGEKDWFAYFRMTKYLPAMENKFDKAMAATQDGETARKIMTSYLAAAVDCHIYVQARPQALLESLAFDLHITPQHFLLLSADDMARMMGRSVIEVRETLSDAGLRIEDGIVKGYRPPPGRNPPKIRPK